MSHDERGLKHWRSGNEIFSGVVVQHSSWILGRVYDSTISSTHDAGHRGQARASICVFTTSYGSIGV